LLTRLPQIQVGLHARHHDGTVAGATVALNQWLEATLAADDNLCASWLWSHDRWRHQDEPHRRLRLESKRNLLPAELSTRHLATLPRKTRFFIRLPNWLGDVVMALPLLRALRASRPDAEITLIAKASFIPLLKGWAIADHYEALPKRGIGYFLHFWKMRRRYPDVYLLFTNSTRGDLEAWFTRCPQRFGIVRPKHRRRLLTHGYNTPPDFDERQHHQLELWENFFRAFGLSGPANRTPPTTYPLPLKTNPVIGLIAGSENTPEKRWPIEHWRTLVQQLLQTNPTTEFLLFGTANDSAITAAIANGLDSTRVKDLAGRTNLPAYVEKLRSCDLLITNDTGGMHLANALGVPLLALFGPTNPVRTGPVFTAPFEILQPPACPSTGGGSLNDLSPTTVLEATTHLLTPGS
jgi:lipopolysaccharide heptosyltransferase II